MSAIERPYVGYYKSIEAKAAALVQSMAGNHGFIDGNKRTTLLLVATLLEKSGYHLCPANSGEDINAATEAMILAVVGKEMAMPEAIAWFRARVWRLP